MFAFLLTSVGAASYARKGFTTTFSFPDMADSTEVVICIHDSESGFGDFRFDTINIVGGHGVLLDEIGLDYPVQAYAFTPAGNFPFFVGNGQSELIHGTNREIADLALNYEGAPWSEDLILYNTYVDAPRGRLNKAMGEFSESDRLTARLNQRELQLNRTDRKGTYAGAPRLVDNLATYFFQHDPNASGRGPVCFQPFVIG